MTVKPSNGLIESFQITLTDKALTMQWENTVASVPVKGK